MRTPREITQPSPRSRDGQSGSVLIAVLVVAAVAMLLGFGRLASFERQVALRIDREARLRRLLASRSAIAWLNACGDLAHLPTETNRIDFVSGERPSAFIVAPSRFVFPETAAEVDYVRSGSTEIDIGGIKYRLTALGDAKSAKGDVVKAEPVAVAFADCPDALWTDSLYGLRYLALAHEVFAPENGVGDDIRFALTPRGQGFSGGTGGGRRADWAIWLEQRPKADGGAVVELFRREGGGGDIRCLDAPVAVQPGLAKGLQLAGGRLGAIVCQPVAEGLVDGLYPAHEIASCRLPATFVTNFTAACRDCGGIELTLEATLCDRSKFAARGDACRNAFWGVAVAPAFDYAIAVRRGVGEDAPFETATVVAIDPGATVDGGEIRAVSYDTHGIYNATGR